MSENRIAWPPELARYVCSAHPDRIRLRPYRAIGGQIPLICWAIATGPLLLVMSLLPRTPSYAFPIALAYTLFFCWPITNFFRWCEVERQGAGWLVTDGIARWAVGRRRFGAGAIHTAKVTAAAADALAHASRGQEAA